MTQIYIETNFIMELALEQSGHKSCEEIIQLCKRQSFSIVLPVFCIAECYGCATRRQKERFKIAEEVVKELDRVFQSQRYEEEKSLSSNVRKLLLMSMETEKAGLHESLRKVLGISETIPLDYETIKYAKECEASMDLDPQDAIVYSSIIKHLKMSRIAGNIMINKNRRHFGSFEITSELGSLGCKLFFDFAKARDYLRHLQQTKDSRSLQDRALGQKGD
jgi:predicted nucleic acid-binding protein